MTTQTSATKLKPGAVYFGDNGRTMCNESTCAGATALFTGRDLSGHRVARVTASHVAEWLLLAPDLPLACECGRVTLTPTHKP